MSQTRMNRSIDVMRNHALVKQPLQLWLGCKAQAFVFWQARSEQERKLLTLGSVVVVLALVWAVLFAPAMEGRTELKKSLPQLRQQAAQLQALAAEAATLSGSVPVDVAAMSRDSLVKTLAARSLTAQSVGMTGEYAKLELRNVSFGALLQWLDAVRREGRISVQDASITAQPTPGLVDATLTLHQDVVK
jgi:general secretion pathway protein M